MSMVRSTNRRTRLSDLADAICQDIRSRGLKPGDVYLTADEAARHLSVSKADANRALQLLASKKLIVRKQGNPPRLAMDVDAKHRATIHKVHVLLPEADIKSEGLFSDGNMLGLQTALPGSQIQFNFLPERGEAEYVEGLVNESLAASRLEAFVLLRSTLRSQQAVGASGLPAVVNGTCYPSVANLSSMDRDHELSAKLHLDYMAGKGCKHILVLMRDRIYAGDQIFFDAFMANHGNGSRFKSPPKIRFLPNDAGMVNTAIAEAVKGVRGKIGVIARSTALAAESVESAEKLDIPVPDEIEITICDYHATGPAKAQVLPHEIDAEWSPQEHGRQTGLLLLRQARGEEAGPVVVRYSTKLVCPVESGVV